MMGFLRLNFSISKLARSLLIIFLWLVGQLPFPETYASTVRLPKHRIDLWFKDVPLRTLLGVMGDLGSMNLVLSEKIEGQTSIQIKQIPWDDAFHVILAQNQLAFEPIGNAGLLWIAPPDEIQLSQKNLSFSSGTEFNKSGQVMIEARIVEADQRFARNLGVKLGIHSNNPTPNQSSHQTGWDLSASGVNGFLPASTSITLLNKSATQLLQLELNGLEANGTGNIVANPRVVTANGIKASIEQGTELPYQSGNKEGSKIHFRKANLKLEVTPKILSNRQVMMDVEINKDSVGMKTEQGYAIDTKNLRSQITVDDGGTAVIGGIYLQTNREDVVKIPLLGDIPLIGRLFSHQAKMNDKTELLVFITPTLIETNPAHKSAP